MKKKNCTSVHFYQASENMITAVLHTCRRENCGGAHHLQPPWLRLASQPWVGQALPPASIHTYDSAITK